MQGTLSRCQVSSGYKPNNEDHPLSQITHCQVPVEARELFPAHRTSVESMGTQRSEDNCGLALTFHLVFIRGSCLLLCTCESKDTFLTLPSTLSSH